MPHLSRSPAPWILVALAAACRSGPADRESPGAHPEERGSDRFETAGGGLPLEAGAGVEPRGETAPAASARELELPAGWESLTDLAFERALDAWLPGDEPRRIDDGTLADLGRALSGSDATALRAAVILARTRDPRADEVLLARLVERVAPPPREPGRDAVDVVAAAALGRGTEARDAATLLTGLAVGRRPHPSLAARVECARSAIALGRDESIPLLLEILRAGTTRATTLARGVDEEDLAWLQVRAAQTLAARAGTTNGFLPESSVEEREAEAARIEALLPGRGRP